MCGNSSPSYKPKAATKQVIKDEEPPEAPPEVVDVSLGEEEKASKKQKKRKAIGTRALAIPLGKASQGGLGGMGI